MSHSYKFNGSTIRLHKKGADTYLKISYPQRYGHYAEIETGEAIFQFNLNGEIRFLKGKGERWPDPQEWLKRSAGNDWIYYSTGGYTGVYEAIGEYYLPNLQYPTNSLIGGEPFGHEGVRYLVNNWYEKLVRLRESCDGPAEVIDFLNKVVANSPVVLAEKARRLFSLSGGRVTVLPPDARHSDYDIIPLTIATGCLYKCRFCKVKSTRPFQEKGKEEIDYQLQALKELYGKDLKNYNSVFLGEHDAFCSSSELLLYSTRRAHEELKFADSTMKGANFYLFASVDSLLNAEEKIFAGFNGLPANFYINVGLESADQKTLDLLGKPLTEKKVEEAFARIQEINDRYPKIEVSANFLMDESLPPQHYTRLMQLLRESLPRKKPKGCVYLSPLKFGSPSRELVFEFNRLKLQSRLPTFLYIIQRL